MRGRLAALLPSSGGPRWSSATGRAWDFVFVLTQSNLACSIGRTARIRNSKSGDMPMQDNELPVAEGEIKGWLEDTDPYSIAHVLNRAPTDRRVEVLRFLPPRKKVKVLGLLNPVRQAEVLSEFEPAERRSIVSEMEPDDRARIISEMDQQTTDQLLSDLGPKERSLTMTLLRYPQHSAGRIMTPETVQLKPDQTVAQALEIIRSDHERAETVYIMPVTDYDHRLLGTVDLSKIVISAPKTTIAELMTSDIPSVSATDDQEYVARLMKSADLMVVPVVDQERLVGIITVDDAMEVMEFEEAEDFARTGAAEPIFRPYLAVPIARLVRSRIVWLSVLALAAVLTVQVLNAFESVLEKVVTLSLFIPLLIGIGGNTGAQSATTVVRALAVGDIRPRNAFAVAAREATAGVLLGALLAAAAFAIIALAFDQKVAIVVSTTMVAICTLAALVGSLMPIAARLCSIDPAVVSAPFVTTIVDATGLLVYFLIAQAVLPL